MEKESSSVDTATAGSVAARGLRSDVVCARSTGATGSRAQAVSNAIRIVAQGAAAYTLGTNCRARAANRSRRSRKRYFMGDTEPRLHAAVVARVNRQRSFLVTILPREGTPRKSISITPCYVSATPTRPTSRRAPPAGSARSRSPYHFTFSVAALAAFSSSSAATFGAFFFGVTSGNPSFLSCSLNAFRSSA